MERSYESKKIDPSLYRSIVGSLRYLIITCTRLDILYGVSLISDYMEARIVSHLKMAKRILQHIEGTLNYGVAYFPSKDVTLYGYGDSDWGGNVDDRKSTTGFIFFLGDTAFTWC